MLTLHKQNRPGPKPEIFDEDGFMIVQDVPFDQLVWVEVTKLDGKKARHVFLSVTERVRRKDLLRRRWLVTGHWLVGSVGRFRLICSKFSAS